MIIERILNEKDAHLPVISPMAKISEMVEALNNEEVGALVVSTDGKTIEGIISERDVIQGLLRFGKETLEKSVRDLMTTDVITCTTDDRIVGVMALMAEKHIRHVPVTDNGELIGIIGIRDIIQLRLKEVQAEADAIRDYISRA